jgi:hypothetical protein
MDGARMAPEKNSAVRYSYPVLTANSAVTLGSSPIETRDLVSSFIGRLADGDAQAQVDPATGHFVSRVGNARVVWKREDNTVVVISIYIP